MCFQFLKYTLNAENVLVIYDIAATYDHDELEKSCVDVVISECVKATATNIPQTIEAVNLTTYDRLRDGLYNSSYKWNAHLG